VTRHRWRLLPSGDDVVGRSLGVNALKSGSPSTVGDKTAAV